MDMLLTKKLYQYLDTSSKVPGVTRLDREFAADLMAAIDRYIKG